ncbi:hypothetical protein D3C75_1048360 [compost metagenome]
MIFSSLEISRSRTSSSLRQLARTLCTTWETNCSWMRRLSSRSTNAISGSIIQNSIKWRRVLDFSARKVGPKEYTRPNAMAAASMYSWPLWVRKASSSKYLVWKSSVVPSHEDGVRIGGSTSLKPRVSKNSCTARIISARTISTARCFGLRSHRWR